MGKALCAGLLLFISLSSQADTCPLPSADSGEPYITLASATKREFYLLLNEYMFLHRWKRHSEAVSAGFRYGDRVYGEVLRSGGQFNAKSAAAWRRAYERSGRSQFRSQMGPRIDTAGVDRAVIDWVLQACLGSGLWSEIRAINDCRFAFTAGVERGAASATVWPARFRVHGGRCAPWPARALSEKGDSVQCVRSGSAAVSLELLTDRGRATSQTLAALAPAQLPPEPVQERKLSGPVTEVVRLWKSRDYRLQQLGRGCPSCGLYAADIRPEAADAVILRAVTVSSSGAGWQPCPAGLRCGVYEFSPPDNRRLSGCEGLPACRIWRLAENDGEASDVVQLTYQVAELACKNCPDNLDFAAARKQWEDARDAVPGRCEIFADSPEQSIKPATRN